MLAGARPAQIVRVAQRGGLKLALGFFHNLANAFDNCTPMVPLSPTQSGNLADAFWNSSYSGKHDAS